MTVNGVMAVIYAISANSGSFRGALRKRSRSLSHLLMSSCVFSERSRSPIAVARPSVCRLSVTLVHRTQAVEIFGNISTVFCTFAIR